MAEKIKEKKDAEVPEVKEDVENSSDEIGGDSQGESENNAIALSKAERLKLFFLANKTIVAIIFGALFLSIIGGVVYFFLKDPSNLHHLFLLYLSTDELY